MAYDRTDHVMLYTNTYSLRSLMTRFTIALRGKAAATSIPVIVEEREVNIYEMEQMNETFMLEVNAKGQVPVLVNPELFPEPLTESLDMAKFFISRYPSLSAPEQYLQEATDLLDELHDLDYFTLSFAHAPMIAETTMKSCEQRLAKATSQRYIDVLEPKLAVYKSHKGRSVTNEELADLDKRSMEFLDKFRAVMRRTEGPWIYGAHGPTALDAHFIIFLHRVRDAGHFDYFDDQLNAYLDASIKLPEWSSVMEGRRTLPPGIAVNKPNA